MVGKTVNASLDVIQFLYPDYQVKSFVSFLDKDTKVIYNGNQFNGLISYLEKNTKSYINTIGSPDLDLTSSKALINYIFNKKGKSLDSSVQLFLETLSDKDLWYFLKVFYITGKYPYNISDDRVSLFSLFKTLTLPTTEAISTYISVVNSYPFSVVEASFLTFLSKVSHLQVDGVSPMYSKLIKQTHNKIHSRIKASVLFYANTEHTSLDLLNLIITLRG